MANIVRKGYGQVQPNHLSGIVTGQIYAQLPATYTSSGSEVAIAQLEQGQYLVYDYANNRCSYTGDGEPMLVYCEEKLYDERKQSHKDFVLKATDFTDGKIYPRLIKTYVGDIYTTNSITVANTADDATVTIGTDATLIVGKYLVLDTATGFLKLSSETSLANITGMAWKIVKVYTMSDGKQAGFKIQRVQ